MSEHEQIKASLRALVDKKRAFEDARRAYKDLEEDFRAYEADLWEELEDGDARSATYDLGEGYGDFQFVPNQTVTGYVLDPDQFLDWVNDTARTEELTKIEFRKAIVNEIVREAINDSRPLPPGLDFTAKRYITQTRKKPRASRRV